MKMLDRIKKWFDSKGYYSDVDIDLHNKIIDNFSEMNTLLDNERIKGLGRELECSMVRADISKLEIKDRKVIINNDIELNLPQYIHSEDLVLEVSSHYNLPKWSDSHIATVKKDNETGKAVPDIVEILILIHESKDRYKEVLERLVKLKMTPIKFPWYTSESVIRGTLWFNIGILWLALYL